LLIKYIKIVLWRVAKRMSHIEDARCLKVKGDMEVVTVLTQWLRTNETDFYQQKRRADFLASYSK